MRKKRRFLLLRATVILAFAVLAGRVWYVQVVMGSYYKQQGDTSKIRFEPVTALRGIIYDRNGRQLVFNTPQWNVTIVPNAIPPDRAWHIYRRLAQVLGNDPSANEIAQFVDQNAWRGYAPIPLVSNVSFDTAMVIKQLHQVMPGVSADPVSVRQYQLDPTLSLAHILGYTQTVDPTYYSTAVHDFPHLHVTASDQVGAAGVEATMDPYLHGINGTEEVEVDAGERPVRLIRPGHAVPGDKIYLTINASFQQRVADDLQTALAKYRLRQGAVVVENVNTGEILALVGLPSYNANWFSGRISTKRWNAIIQDPAHPLEDISIAGEYPPGSTYKIITAAAALQTGVVNANTTYDDTGEIDLFGHVFHGWKSGGLGSENIIGAIAQSSDIYFYTVAGGNPNLGAVPHTGPWRLARFARLFGMGSKSGIELPGESAGLVPDPGWLKTTYPGTGWYIGDTYNMGIGQGYNLVTPLQLCNATAAVANGGTLYRPRIIERIEGRVNPQTGALPHSTVLQPFVPQIIRRNFIDPTNISLIQQGMHLGVASNQAWFGTSWLAHDPRIDAAGKTGTAEDPHGAPDAWWTGYAPYNNPKIAVTVLVPNANAEGAYYAAPIAHRIMEDYFHLKPAPLPDLPHDTNWLDDVTQQMVGGIGQ